MKEKKKDSPAGNRTRVVRVTGGNTHHYTTEDLRYYSLLYSSLEVDCHSSREPVVNSVVRLL